MKYWRHPAYCRFESNSMQTDGFNHFRFLIFHSHSLVLSVHERHLFNWFACRTNKSNSEEHCIVERERVSIKLQAVAHHFLSISKWITNVTWIRKRERESICVWGNCLIVCWSYGVIWYFKTNLLYTMCYDVHKMNCDWCKSRKAQSFLESTWFQSPCTSHKYTNTHACPGTILYELFGPKRVYVQLAE